MDSTESIPDSEPLPPEVEALFESALAKETGPGIAAWRTTWSWVVAVMALSVLGWLTFTRDGWVPLLSNVDFGVHEFGHMIMMWAPGPVSALAGSAAQVLAPLGLAAYFLWRRDLFASTLMTGWAASSLNNVSVYIYDATRLQLSLWGDVDGTSAGHDWANILTKLKLIPHTDAITYAMRGLSVALFAGALGLAVWGFVRARSAQRPA